MLNRRQILRSGAVAGAVGCLGWGQPAWAKTAAQGNIGLPKLTGTRFSLSVDKFPVQINGRRGQAVGINHNLPAPLIRFREGERITISVANRLDEETSIHWHGLLVPFEMDGVPGVTFPGIAPGETFHYRFAVPQSGTYWYHSHSGLQEQRGHYGPLIIDPKGADPVDYDREYVLVLSDWSFENPHRVFEKLKKSGETYNFNKRTLPDFLGDARKNGLAAALEDRLMWGAMRMSPRDIADVTSDTYTYLINGHSTHDNWHGAFEVGEKIRLRIINASAMTIFNVRIPGLPMAVVQADGLNVRPVEIDEFQIGVAETYDVVVTPQELKAYAIVAESIDRSGQVVATLAPAPNMRATAPALRPVPTLTMKDMGMAHHGAMDHHAGHHDMGHHSMDHSDMDHSDMDHGKMDHGARGGHEIASMRGPGIDALVEKPINRLGEPGVGLEDMGHRVLTYKMLQSLEPNPDQRPPARELDIHLTGNMERYMWSFDGVKFSEIMAPIKLIQGERVRFTLTNNTMMSHPIHLHGMFFDLVTDDGAHKPRKHTVIVKPAERLSFDVTAEAIGDWAFHCHLLYHMHAGMMQIVSVLPNQKAPMHDHHRHHEHHGALEQGERRS